VRLYQVTCITLDFVLFKGGWYILILPVGTRFFNVLRSRVFHVRRFCDDAEEASLKMPSRTTAAIEAGVRGLGKRVSRKTFRSSMIFAHQRQPTSGYRRAYLLPNISLRSGWYLCVHDMYGPNGLNNSRSAIPSSPT